MKEKRREKAAKKFVLAALDMEDVDVVRAAVGP